MFENFNLKALPIFFLKATAKKQVWIPQFVKKNGQVVGGHYAMVHVADDHDHHKVAGGAGTYSQKKAHAGLKDEPEFHKLGPEDQAALIMHHATQIQDAESAAARLATLKKKLLAGQAPTPGEWKHFHAAPADKQQTITEAVHAAGHGAKMDAQYAAWVAQQPPANEMPADAAPLAPPKAAGTDEKANALISKVAKEIKASSEAKAFGHKVIEQAEAIKKKYEGKPLPPMAKLIIANAEKMAAKMAKHAPKAAKPAPASEPKPESEKSASASPAGLVLPDFQEGKEATGVKDHYEKMAQKIIDAAAAGDVAGLAAMPNPDKGQSWKGKTANSKLLMALHAAALAQAKGEVPAAAAPAPEAKGERANKFAEAKADPSQALVDQLGAAGFQAKVHGAKGVVLSNESGYAKTYANAVQANSAAQKLALAGFHASVIGMHPYLVAVHGKADASAPTVDNGPKEGDTKEGADGTLVLKDGHWVKQDEPAAAESEPADDPAHDAQVAAANAEPDDTKALQALVNAFHDAKVVLSNTNAKAFNPKVDAIIAALQAGDKGALLAMNYGTNTYGKKAAKMANEALAFLGSRHQVKPGQKAGQHSVLQADPAPAPAAEPAPAVVATPPAVAPSGLAVPALDGASAGVKAVLAEAQQHFAAKDIAKLELIEASTNGLASYSAVHGWVVAALGQLEAEMEAGAAPDTADAGAQVAAPDPALITGWKEAIAQGKAPTKAQAQAMDALAKFEPDEHLDHMAEANVDLAMQMGLPMESEESAAIAEAKMVGLHAIALAAPGLDAGEIPHPSGWADKEIAAAGKRAAMAGDLDTLKNMAQQAYDNDEAGTFNYLNSLVSKLTVKQKQAADLAAAAAAAAAPGLTADELPNAGKAAGKIALIEMQQAAMQGDLSTLNILLAVAWEDGEQAAHSYGTILKELLEKKQGQTAAAQGPKDGDTKQGADGMLVFQNGRWHKMGTDPKVLKQKAASVPMPKLSGKNSIKMNKTMKALKAMAEAQGAAGLEKMVKITEGGQVKISSGQGNPYGWKGINPQGSAYGANAEAMAAYAKNLVTAMEGTTGAPSASATPPTPAPAAPAPATPSIASPMTEKVGKITAMVADKWEQTGPQKGSNPGGRFKDSKGQEWYCKFPSDPDTVKNELLAAKFYQMLGVEVPELRLVKRDGKLGIASKWVDGLSMGDAAALAGAEGAHQGFVFDAWLANWDVIGLSNDNMLLKDGKAVRVDVGGSLIYRAQGGKKGDAFGETVTELDTLLDPAKNGNAAAVFGKITPADLNAGGEVLAKMHPNQIDKLCRTFGPGSRAEQEALAAKLAARREFILKKLGITDPWNAPAPDITKLTVDPADLPPPIDFNNYPGKGGGLSSKKHINDQNTADDAALIDFAKQGNLKALQDYHYDAYDKETGAYLGKKPIGEHPSKDIKNHHAALCDLLTAIAHPPVAGLDLPPIGGGSIDEVSEAAGAIKPGENIKTVSPDKVIGFWMKLGHVGADAVKDLIPEKTSYLNTNFVAKAKNWYKGASQGTKALVNSVLNSGAYNRFWNNGDKTISISSHGHSYSGGAQTLAKQVYDDAYEFEGGETVGRWMNLPETMKEQLLKEGAGLVFQNADSMCTSIFKNWGDNAKFGSGAFLNIRFAKGAKAMASLGSGRFSASTTNAAGEYVFQGSGEMEITTLMGQRFVVLEVKKGNASSANGITLELLALPPHDGYVAELGNMAQLGKALGTFSKASMSMLKAMVVFVKRFAKKI